MPASYFLGSRLLAVTDLPPLWDDVRPAGVSRLFMCPDCGEVWGRIALPDTRWMAVAAGCRKHPQWLEDVGGSFLASWRHNLRDLPAEVLAYELAIRLANYEDHK